MVHSMYELEDIMSKEIGSVNHEWIIAWYWIWRLNLMVWLCDGLLKVVLRKERGNDNIS